MLKSNDYYYERMSVINKRKVDASVETIQDLFNKEELNKNEAIQMERLMTLKYSADNMYQENKQLAKTEDIYSIKKFNKNIDEMKKINKVLNKAVENKQFENKVSKVVTLSNKKFEENQKKIINKGR